MIYFIACLYKNYLTASSQSKILAINSRVKTVKSQVAQSANHNS